MKDRRHGNDPLRTTPARPRVVLAAGAVAVIVLLLAACGSSPKKPARSGAAAQGAKRAVAYADCIRSHGVPSFPDPQVSAGGGSVGVGQSIPAKVANSPAFTTAQQACQSLAPQGEGPGGGAHLTAQQQAQLVTFAHCMRSHQFPAFPDPNGQGVFQLPASIRSNSSAFQTATQTCGASRLSRLAISSQR